jgi:hypothetical protein
VKLKGRSVETNCAIGHKNKNWKVIVLQGGIQTIVV